MVHTWAGGDQAHPDEGLKPAATRVEGNRVSQGLETQDVAEVNVK